VQDSQEFKQKVFGSHGLKAYYTDIDVSRTIKPAMCFRGHEIVALTRGEDRLSDSVGGLSCVSCVRTKLHMSTRTSVRSHRVLMKT
jgi:hypothetical protein